MTVKTSLLDLPESTRNWVIISNFPNLTYKNYGKIIKSVLRNYYKTGVIVPSFN